MLRAELEGRRQYKQTTDQRGALLLDSACYTPPLLGAQDQAVETATRVECDAYQKPELWGAVFHCPGDTQTNQHTTESLALDIRGASLIETIMNGMFLDDFRYLKINLDKFR